MLTKREMLKLTLFGFAASVLPFLSPSFRNRVRLRVIVSFPQNFDQSLAQAYFQNLPSTNSLVGLMSRYKNEGKIIEANSYWDEGKKQSVLKLEFNNKHSLALWESEILNLNIRTVEEIEDDMVHHQVEFGGGIYTCGTQEHRVALKKFLYQS